MLHRKSCRATLPCETGGFNCFAGQREGYIRCAKVDPDNQNAILIVDNQEIIICVVGSRRRRPRLRLFGSHGHGH